MGLETRERNFDAEARRRGGKRGERIAEMGGRRVPGGVEKVKGLRSAETAEDGSLRAGAEGFPERVGGSAWNAGELVPSQYGQDFLRPNPRRIILGTG
jgi:hypothetical protein